MTLSTFLKKKIVVSELSNRIEDNVIWPYNENTGLKTYPPLQISIRNARTHNSLSARETPYSPSAWLAPVVARFGTSSSVLLASYHTSNSCQHSSIFVPVPLIP